MWWALALSVAIRNWKLYQSYQDMTRVGSFPHVMCFLRWLSLWRPVILKILWPWCIALPDAPVFAGCEACYDQVVTAGTWWSQCASEARYGPVHEACVRTLFTMLSCRVGADMCFNLLRLRPSSGLLSTFLYFPLKCLLPDECMQYALIKLNCFPVLKAYWRFCFY